MKNVKKMIQAGLKKFTVITILGVFLMTSLIPVSAATKVSKIKWSAYRKTMYVGNAQRFAVKITPAKASKAKLGWKTSNKKIAKVSAKALSHRSAKAVSRYCCIMYISFSVISRSAAEV